MKSIFKSNSKAIIQAIFCAVMLQLVSLSTSAAFHGEIRYASEGSHFIISSRLKLSDNFLKMTEDILEAAYRELGDTFSCFPSDKIEVIIISADHDRPFRHLPSWARGVYDGRITIQAINETRNFDSLKLTIAHEYTHHLVSILSNDRCPTWLNEGLAQLAEGRNLRLVTTCNAFADLPENGFLRLDTLDFQKMTKKDVECFYALSLVTTDKLVKDHGMRIIKQILRSIAQGSTLKKAYENATGSSFDDFENEVLEMLSAAAPYAN